MNSPTLPSSARRNASRSSLMKNNGPPRNTTVPKIDAARSGFAAPSLMSGCRSVFAKTPQRDAIGYRCSYARAISLRPAASVSKSVDIWSMNAPVPPAHDPFIRCSGVGLRYVIFASSPPSSMMTSACGTSSSIARVSAMTSCTNGTWIASASARPPEPVIARRTGSSARPCARSVRAMSSSRPCIVARTFAWWRR